MKTLRQRGELALTLSLLGIFISLVGIGLGTNLSRNVQQSSSQAQDFFTYKSTLEIRNEAGQVIPWEPDFTWDNAGAGAGLTKGDIKTPPSQLAQVIYDATKAPGVEKSLQGFSATVVISIPEQKYEIVSAFCEDIYGNTCTKSIVTNDFRTRSKMVISNGAEIKYGLVVRSKTTPQPTTEPIETPTTAPTTTQVPNSCPISGSECAPRNVVATASNEKTVDISWDLPQGCSGFKEGSDFWIDVERPGESIVCAAEGGSDGSKQCVLGKTTGFTLGRQLDTNSEEFRKRSWDENRRYDVKVYTHNASPSCVNTTPGVGSFTYEVAKPTTEPTDTPTGKLQCNRPCIYSEGPANSPRCWRGACPADKPECGGGIAENEINNGCAYAGDVCRIRQEVNCKTGENIGTSGETACAKESGSCIPEANCAAEAGGTTRKDLAGCSGRTVCCVLPPKQETIKLSYDLNMKPEFINKSFLFEVVVSNRKSHTYETVAIEGSRHIGAFNILVDKLDSPDIYLVKYIGIDTVFLDNIEGDVSLYAVPVSKMVYEADNNSEKSVVSFLNMMQSLGGGYNNKVVQEMIEGDIRLRNHSVAQKSQLSSLLEMYDTSASKHKFTITNNYSNEIIVNISDPSMLNYDNNGFSRHYLSTQDNKYSFLIIEDLYTLFSLDIGNGTHSFRLKNMKVGDGKYVFIDSVPSNYVVVSSTGCSDMKKLGSKWRCTIHADNKDIAISIVKEPAKEPGDNYPAFASTALNTSDTQYKLATLTICGSDSCEDVPLSTFRSIEDYESKLGAITHVSCSATADDGAIVNCDPVSLMSNGTHFIQITNDESGDKAQIVTQSQIADVDGDKMVTGLDLANVLAGYSSNESDLNGDGATNSLDLTLILGKIDSEVEYNMRHFERPTLAE